MNVELLVVADCPNENPAGALLRTALRDVGLAGVDFATTVIGTLQQAERRGFTGSPTILINGSDPFAEPGRLPALACRVYPHPDGPTGVPDLRHLRQALQHAAGTGPT
jgi:hypothetical protein